ncbi:MAG: hypothetical protein AAF789_01135 [Bacteroidota bacterium]
MKEKSIEQLIGELNEKEDALKSLLQEQANNLKSQGKKFGSLAVGVGLVGLLTYGAYKMLSTKSSEKPKKKKSGRSGNRLISFITPYAKRFLDDLLKD